MWEFAKESPILFFLIALVLIVVIGNVLQAFAERNKPKAECLKCDQHDDLEDM